MSPASSSALAPSPLRGGLEAFFDKAHRRLGRWYLHVLLACTVLGVVLVTMPVENITQVPLWTGRGFSEWWYIWVFMVAAGVVGPFVLPAVVYMRHRPLFELQRGEPIDPIEGWNAAVTKAPGTAMIATGVWGLGIIIPGVLWVGAREDFDTSTYFAAAGPQLLMMLGSGASYLMLHELAWIPFVREVAQHLPADFVPAYGFSVRRRLMLITTTITFTIGCEAAGLAMGFDDRSARIWAVVLGTVGLILTFVGLLLALVSFGLTRRVDELARTLSTVGRDKLHVYPSYGDEFDEVGRAVNRTVELLDEHDRGLRESRARLVAVADDTRRRTERDLHDGAQQHLAMVSMKLGLLARRAAERSDVAEPIARMRGELAEAIGELRALAHGIYPVALEHEGVVGAVRAAATQSKVSVIIDVPHDLPRWPHDVEAALYFCCWELIQGVARRPTITAPVRVTIAERDGVGRFSIYAPLAFLDRDHATILFLQDRIGAVGGDVTVAPRPEGIVAEGEVRVS
jgi:signal transduction histidine kinase